MRIGCAGLKICASCGSGRCSDDWICSDCGSRPELIGGFNAFAPALALENEGFREEYFGELAALEAGNFWFRARNDLIVWAMRTYFPDCASFLEVGCGTGFVLAGIGAAFPSIALSGSEIFRAGLEFASLRVPYAQFYQMDARRIPFHREFDVIGAFDVLEHIDEDVTVVDEVHKALRQGGGFIATVPQHQALWSQQDVHAHHVRRYSAAALRHKVEASGFEVVRLVSFVSLLLPMMFASRLRMRDQRSESEFDALQALRMSRPVNTALEAVMSIERAMIRRGLSFPAGGSLLVIARKRSEAEGSA
jgi:SAM-dependent methyltransferase